MRFARSTILGAMVSAALDFGPFELLTPQMRERLRSQARRVELVQGDVLIRELSASSGCYALVSGALAVKGRDGGTISTLRPPSLVGEIGPVLGRPRTATVVVEEPGEALFIPVIALREAIADVPAFEKALRDFIAARLG